LRAAPSIAALRAEARPEKQITAATIVEQRTAPQRRLQRKNDFPVERDFFATIVAYSTNWRWTRMTRFAGYFIPIRAAFPSQKLGIEFWWLT
jgi:hypothetical protein